MPQSLDVQVAVLSRDQKTLWSRTDDIRQTQNEHHSEDDRRYDLLVTKIDALADRTSTQIANAATVTDARFNGLNAKFIAILTSVLLLVLALLGNIAVTLVR